MARDRVLTLMVFVIILVSFLAVIINLPSTTLYSPFNSGDSGYSQLVAVLHAEIMGNVEDIPKDDCSNTAVIIPFNHLVGETRTYSVLRELIAGGATLIIMDESGYSNTLLKYLGVDASVVNQVVLDEVAKLKDRNYPIIEVTVPVGGRTLEFTAFRPAHILLHELANVSVLGTTSGYAYADLDGSGYYSLGEVMKHYAVVISQKVGNGTVILISDLDAGSNALISEAGNEEFFKLLTAGRKVYFIVEGLSLEPLDEIKYVFSMMRIGTYYRSATMALAKFLILAAVFAVIYYAEGRGIKR